MEAKIEDVNSVVSFLCAGVEQDLDWKMNVSLPSCDCESRLNQV